MKDINLQEAPAFGNREMPCRMAEINLKRRRVRDEESNIVGIGTHMLFRTYVPSRLLTPLVKQEEVVILMRARDLRFPMRSQEIRNSL